MLPASEYLYRLSEIKKIEQMRGTSVIDVKQIDYINTFSGNTSYLPSIISTSKTGATMESRIQFLDYDQYGSPLSAKMINGTTSKFIWGYNNSLPIAIIENAPDSITQTLITEAQTASNSTDANAEATLLTKLAALRAALPNAMVSTFTHKAGIGVSTVTDAKGDKMTYEYDGFGRLKCVRDNFNKIVSENKYNYRTQTSN